MPTVLALETSCDESAAAVLRQEGEKLTVLSHGIASQVEEHAKWGGVVPEIASRRHVEALPNLVEHALKEAGLVAADLDAIAATVTPGLVGALMVGSITGRTLAALHQKPFLAVHHLEAHLASVFLADHPPHAPYLVLLVSGGHTELIRVDQLGEMERLGRSHDDAAGEAFDKVARLMGLGYPGGPAIQAIAVEGDAKRFRLPKGRVSKPGGGFYPYDFSFSGLKTAVLRHVEALKRESEDLPLADLAASFEQIVADVLVRPFIAAGMVGLLLMAPLALTSTAGWIRRLGPQRWQRLHQLVYLAAAAGVLHFWWKVKADTREPLVYVAILGVLLLLRLPGRARLRRWRQRLHRVRPAALGADG